MRLIQFEHPQHGRRVGLISPEDDVIDLTSLDDGWTHVWHLFLDARRSGHTMRQHLDAMSLDRASTVSYGELLDRRPGDAGGWLLPPLDHPDPAHCLVTGTGLTHLGSMETRDQMHTDASREAQTDSERMFSMGLEGGRPQQGERGVQPEWFYKGTGAILRGRNDFLDIPDFTEDGGEEPEIVGCYVIDDDGVPCRLGFAMGNEWADHRMEQVNYLWLAPSKLRCCAIGPELVTDQSFSDVRGHCRIFRDGEEIYHSGELLTGEEHMSHTLANLEDHQFKYPQFRQPGDVHIHFFGTMKLSFPNRPDFETDDRIEIAFQGMGAPLANRVRKLPRSEMPVRVDLG